MNVEEIKEIIKLISESDTIGEIKLVSGDVKIKLKKIGKDVVVFNERTAPPPTFSKASTIETQKKAPEGNNATPGQIKFARDLVEKVFEGDDRAAMDAIAHALELPLSDIPDLDTWDTTLTRDMVGPIIDRLGAMYKMSKRKFD